MTADQPVSRQWCGHPNHGKPGHSCAPFVTADQPLTGEELGQVVARIVDGQTIIDRADPLIEVSGELAEMLGVNPPLDGRIKLADGVEYDLAVWSFSGMPGRYPGTYLGRRV